MLQAITSMLIIHVSVKNIIISSISLVNRSVGMDIYINFNVMMGMRLMEMDVHLNAKFKLILGVLNKRK